MDLFAYIDPGTGSVFIQAVIGTVLAGLFFLRNFVRHAFYKVKGIFGGSKAKPATDAKDTKADDKKDETTKQ